MELSQATGATAPCAVPSSAGIGRTHVVTALAVQAIEHSRKKVWFFSRLNLVNALEQEKAASRPGHLADRRIRLDLVILGDLPFSASGVAVLFRLLSRSYERTSVVVTINLSLSEWGSALGNTKTKTALLDQFTHRCHILDTGNDSLRSRSSSAVPQEQGDQSARLTHTRRSRDTSQAGSFLNGNPGSDLDASQQARVMLSQTSQFCSSGRFSQTIIQRSRSLIFDKNANWFGLRPSLCRKDSLWV